MYERILIGYQETAEGRDALALGALLARACKAELIQVTAQSDDGETLAQLAQLNRADLIVIGASHRGPVGRVFPGATVERLLGEAPCAVAVAPPEFSRHEDGDTRWSPLSGNLDDIGMRVIGVGYDGTPASAVALRSAAELAVVNGAAMRVYTVARKYAHGPGSDADAALSPGMPTEAEVLRQMLHEAVGTVPSEARALPVFLRGFPAEELIKACDAGVDLLVLGSRGGGPVRRKLHHSVTSLVMQAAKCPVLISPRGVSAPKPAMT
ncbi:MAG TPA: universal stress protein [Solirubrobacterales bacterium]